MWPPGAGPLLAPNNNLNKFGRDSLGGHTN